MNVPTSHYYIGCRPEVATFLPKHYTRVLEIGCGEGGFRANLRSDCEYWGVEPVASVAKTAELILDRVLNGTYEAVENELPDGYFDLIICNDVIEHMVSHDQFLNDIRKKMTVDGCIVGSIPNVRYLPVLFSLLVKKEWKYEACGVLDRTHLRFFTERSLRRTFIKHHYDIKVMTGINPISTTRYRAIWPFIKILLGLIFGQDIMFIQFAFRVQPSKSDKTNLSTLYSDR